MRIGSMNHEGGGTKADKVIDIPFSELLPFPNHPFKVVDDESMTELAESIRDRGVLVPAIVRPCQAGGYEIIAGHRRQRGCELAGLDRLPAIVRDLDDDAATIIMVDSNIQRENLLPSERAYAYKMKLDAMKHQGQRTDLTSAQVGRKLERQESRDILAEQFGQSRSQISRYIRLTELIPPLMEMVDDHRIAFNPAVELSYLSYLEQNQDLLNLVDGGKLKLGLAVQISYLDTEAQCWLADHHQESGCWPSATQIKELRALFEQGELTQDAFAEVMNREQPVKQNIERDDFVASVRDEHFPDMTVEDVKQKLLELIEQYQHRKRMGM